MDIGIGATLACDDDGGEDNYVAVSPLLALTPPDPDFGTWEYVEVDGDRVKKSIPSTDDPGEWSFEIEYTKEKLTRMKALRGKARFYKVVFVDGAIWKGPAIMKKAGSTPGETGQVIVCNLRCSGAWSYSES
jgi:hypothetical protein